MVDQIIFKVRRFINISLGDLSSSSGGMSPQAWYLVIVGILFVAMLFLRGNNIKGA